MTVDLAGLTAPCADAFGEPVTYSPATGGSFSVPGIFDEAYREVTLAGDGSALTTAMPVLGVRLADFTDPPLQGDQLTIVRTGETYVVKEVRVDGHGWAQLLLNFAW